MTLWFSVKSIVVRCLIYLASIKIVQCFKQPEDKLEKVSSIVLKDNGIKTILGSICAFLVKRYFAFIA